MNNFDKIQLYLDDKMSHSEKNSFEKRIAVDQDLSVEIELQRQENLAIEKLAHLQLKQRIIELDQKNTANKSNSKKSSSQISKFVIVLILLTAISLLAFFLLRQQRSIDSEMEMNESNQNLIENPVQDGSKKEIKSTNEKNEAIQKQNSTKKAEVNKPSSPIIKKKQNKVKPDQKVIPEVKKINEDKYKILALSNLSKNTSNLRGDSGEINTDADWNVVLNFIQDKQYLSAITLIDSFNDDNIYYLDAQLKKAQCLMKVSKFKEASVIYKYLIQEGDDFIIDTYEYEMLISLVGQLPKTDAEFRALYKKLISNSDFTYSSELEKVKEDLQKLGFSFE